MSIDTIFDTKWDVIIIGSGMAGSSVAYQLTQHQKKVLLVEKGYENCKEEGVEFEQENIEERLSNGKWPTKITATIGGDTSEFWAPLGCGVGGSTLLYSAALQRLQPNDFDEQVLPNGQTIQWPYNYATLEPYYQQAEKLFNVCGTSDPLDNRSRYTLKPPPAMCTADQHFFHQFQSANLHPYRLHIALQDQKSGKHEHHRPPKHDANSACVQPALSSGYLTVLANTEVIRIDADKTSVKKVYVKHDQNVKTLQAKQFVLTAGAYFSPVILQRSTNEHWPNGLANDSGLVGRNLMFHAGDFIAFWPRKKCSHNGEKKSLSIRDFYTIGDKKWGEIQSTGIVAEYAFILYGLRLMFDQSILKKLPLLRHFLRIPAYIASKLFGKATVFTTIIEDFPYPENRVVLDPNTRSGMRIDYTIHDEFRRRVTSLKETIRQRVSFLKSLPMTTGVNLNYGHPCGTCKAGRDPNNSVVDQHCKAHGLDNLYIADGSFMPTSGGTNPSLTIAANALRVADQVALRLDSNELSHSSIPSKISAEC